MLEHTQNPHSFIAAQIACLRGGAADSKDSQDSRNLGGESCGDSRVGGARSGESCVAESRGAATQNAESCLNPAVVSDVAGGGGALEAKKSNLSSPKNPANPKNPTPSQNPTKRLIIAVPAEDSFVGVTTNGILNMPPHHISRYSDKCLENIAEIFGIRLVALIHEPLQKEHRAYYKSVAWANMWLKPRLIDTRLVRKVVNRLGFFARRLGLIRVPKGLFGHTVLAVYEV